MKILAVHADLHRREEEYVSHIIQQRFEQNLKVAGRFMTWHDPASQGISGQQARRNRAAGKASLQLRRGEFSRDAKGCTKKKGLTPDG
jgi:hypothetical protein